MTRSVAELRCLELMDTQYQSPQDEGYSEDPLTMRAGASGNSMTIPEWISALPAHERARIAMSIIKDLPTTIVADIVDELRPRLCLDFIERLPTEVCLKILSYLDPVSLINVALSSQDAKALAFDWKLWEHLYYLEGWATVPGEVKAFQHDLNERSVMLAHTDSDTDDEILLRASKKRATPALVSKSSRNEDTEMEGVELCKEPVSQSTSLFGGAIIAHPNDLPASNLSGHSPGCGDATNQSSTAPTRRRSSQKQPRDKLLTDISNLVTIDRDTGRQSLNWRNLYTQRRRLEANWDAGKSTNFQIPHPRHMYEAHSECIYTIQFQGRYLVSGSRDKSLRIWDLDTRRLALPPLIGHTGSVLCLQFDTSPEEDLIVSGSSDASVILWKFSTGQAIKVLKRAHSESVLNVRFDSRILVTCSKDKMIKIFNRHNLSAGEVGYPRIPSVAPVPIVLNNYGYNPSPFDELPVLKPYTQIGVLEGHGAAVNAVQIWKNEVVSASGDRHVKVWDWPMQSCVRTLIGHTKGIACVQYDGRRIVSGSSDNEVKVFDKETGLEVASLRAHSALVRTVQAGFGDLPYSVEEDAALAKTVDSRYFDAVRSGTVPRSIVLSRGRSRNAGSRQPEDIMAYGAKLPPGGGGGPYGRIVSGSYDESVIIWRRDKAGVWKAKHRFRQENAARVAANTHEPVIRNTTRKSSSASIYDLSLPPSDTFYNHFIDKATHAGPAPLRQLLKAFPQIITSPRLQSMIKFESDPEMRRQLEDVYNQERNLATVASRIPALTTPIFPPRLVTQPHPRPQTTQTTQSTPPPGPAVSLEQLQSQHHYPIPHPLLPHLAFPTDPITHPHQGPQVIPHGTTSPVPYIATQPVLAIPPPNPTQPTIQPSQRPESAARVFKLQFDARRIICCSQTAVIVGWDFANGDEKIIEASRFFSPIE